MKYAAKRTWPEKSPSWEHQDEAESMDAFAKEFAALEKLGLDHEFVVIEKEGGESRSQYFRVSGQSPYQVTPFEPGQASDPIPPATPASSPGATGTQEPEPFAPDFRPAISMLVFMGKVSVGATLLIAVLGFLIKYAQGT